MTLLGANEIPRQPARAEAHPRPARRAPDNAVRVLHIAQSVAGGVATFFEELAPYQNETFGEANVNFLIPEGGEIHLPHINPSQIMTFHATSRRPSDLLKFGQAARKAVDLLRPNLVHLHSSFAGAVVRAALLPTRSRPQIVYCPHGWSFGMETGRAAKFVYAAIERLLARRTNLILVNSTSEYELAVQFGLPQHNILRVGNGIGWAPAPAPRLARRSGPLQVAFVGRHDRQKGLDILLDAIRRFGLQHIHFHIVGEPVLGRHGDGHFDARNVTFHGWLPRSETSALLQDMDAVVMPSRWEAFGLVAIEAMRAGVPVIGSNRGALPEVIKVGGGYTFDIDDADALGHLLERLDAEELRRLGRSARHLWEREYVADRMNQLTSEAYQEVLAGTGARSLFWPAADSRRPFPQTLSGGKIADAS